MNAEIIDNMTDEQREVYNAALAAKVDAFGAALVAKRKAAIDGRKESGIEDEWSLAEDSYQGIDAANGGGSKMGKPSSPNGGYINGPVSNKALRSTVFLNITRPYTDAAAAKVGDMLLPTDDSPWGIKPTPKPHTQETLGTFMPGVVPAQPMPNMPHQPAPGMPMDPAGAAQQGGIPMGAGGPDLAAGQPGPSPVNPIQQAIDEQIRAAKIAAEGAEKQIEDWLVECQWHSEVRKMIEDCARLGTGVLKGPYPIKRSSTVTVKDEQGAKRVKEDRIAPASRCISPWKFYPDPACGESIQEGSFCWELDEITARSLRDLKDVPGYLASQIDKVLEEGPGGEMETDSFQIGNVKARDDDQFKIWYFYGFASTEDLLAAGVEIDDDQGELAVPTIVTMVNNTVIKAALSPHGTGAFPYDVMVWQRKPNVPWGSGIPVQINTAQRMLNAATRNMMDNAGYSAGPQLVMRRDVIVPADGTWQITPRKIWFVKEGADISAVNQAFLAVNIPTQQAQLMEIIQFALKMAEDVTGLPMLMQGQQGAAPDTVGGMQMMLNNASVVLRRIARLFDDRVTEPHIRRYYDWIMEYGEDDSIKGDFQIDARGSTALVERDIQNQAIVQMGALVGNPAFGIDPEKWFAEMCKAQRLDPKRLQMDDEQKAAMASQPPPKDTAVTVAEIRAQVEMQKAEMMAQVQAQIAEMRAQVERERTQMESQASVEKMRLDTDRDTVFIQSQNQRDMTNAQAKMSELELKRELAMLDYANKQQVTLEQVKARLAETVMKLNVQKELAGAGGNAPQVVTPPMEPVGRAPDGQAFQK